MLENYYEVCHALHDERLAARMPMASLIKDASAKDIKTGKSKPEDS